MQDILETRDRLRAEIEGLDGGYATVGRVMKQSGESILQALSPKRRPRLQTLERIQDAINKARKNQILRLAAMQG